MEFIDNMNIEYSKLQRKLGHRLFWSCMIYAPQILKMTIDFPSYVRQGGTDT